MKKTVGIVLFGNFHQKKDTASSRIRGEWLIKYWPEAEAFVQGKTYETVIYQKAYFIEHARAFKGKKILDICDPDWLEGIPTAGFMDLMDHITCSTEAMKEAIENFCDKPVTVIRDRIDFETLPEPKVDSGLPAKEVVWFGYSHNMNVFEPALVLIGSLGLKIRLVTNGGFSTTECAFEAVKWTPETSNAEIQKADFAILPEPTTGTGPYKSENKETLANALGLAVAKNSDDLRRFIDPEERQKEVAEKLKWVRENYDVRRSVEEMKAVIESIKK